MKSLKHVTTDWLNSDKSTSVLPSIIYYVVNSVFCSSSKVLLARDRLTSDRLLKTTCRSLSMSDGLTPDQLRSKFSSSTLSCKYRITFSNERSEWFALVRVSFLSRALLSIRPSMICSTSVADILQSTIYSSSRWCGIGFLKTGISFSIALELIAFIL